MTTLVIDAAFRSKLGNLAEAVQFKDEAGRVLGHFLPLLDGAHRKPQIGEEEIERRLRDGGGRPLAEIMSDLEKRA